MPVLNPFLYEQTLFPQRYCVNTFTRFDKPFHFLYDRISDISKAIFTRYGYHYCMKSYFNSFYIRNNIGLLNRPSDLQVADLYHNGFGDFFPNSTDYIHSECKYAVYEIQAQYPGKICDQDTLSLYKKYFKVCERCYIQGNHYGNLKKHFKIDDLTEFELRVEFQELHFVHFNISNIFEEFFVTGNMFFDKHERYNSFEHNAYYCNQCQRALIDNLTFTSLNNLLYACTYCGMYDIFGDENDVQNIPVHEIHMCTPFVKSDVLTCCYAANNAKRRLSFSEDLGWFDCKRPKREVPRLGILAARAAAGDI